MALPVARWEGERKVQGLPFERWEGGEGGRRWRKEI